MVNNYMRSRAPWAGIVGVSCAALALWFYTSRPSKHKRPPNPTNLVTTPTPGPTPLAPPGPRVLAAPVMTPLSAIAQPPPEVSIPIPGVPVIPSTTVAPVVVAHRDLALAPAATPPVLVAAPQAPPTTAPPVVPAILGPVPAAAPQALPAIAPVLMPDVQPAPASNLWQLEPPVPRFVIQSLNPPDITLYIKTETTQVASESHQDCAQSLLQNTSDYKVTANIDPRAGIPWSFKSLQEIGKGFSALKDDDSQFLRCKTLTVNLPRTLPKKNRNAQSNNVEINPFVLPATNTLTWTSHRNQLPLLIDPTVVPPLTHLTVNCDFSTRDCAVLMREFAATLQVLNVRKLIGPANDDSLSTLPLNPPPLVNVDMVALHTLDIESDFNPGTMLNGFEFLALEEFKLTTYRCELKFFVDKKFGTIPWNRIQRSTIIGDFIPRQSQILKAICAGNPNDHHHNYKPATAAPQVIGGRRANIEA
ncbi:hypothetical protein DXG01_005725 [Tephrocybe rancida]|nr:hypothetical protein DXG01_005725 [Tephrocybe rancida]